MKLLVTRGADVNARAWAEQWIERSNGEWRRSNGEWRTPLGMARKGNHEAVVAFLLGAGAQEDGSTSPIHRMSSSMRPTILHREKAQYTREARDNKVEGTVILSAVFGVDSQISDIKVIRGLPHGLTEKAIEAAKEIRFEPAMKDGQPVSVRGNLEFTFRL